MRSTPVRKGAEYDADYLFRNVRDAIHALHPETTPYLALFGCSDEVTGSADAVRTGVFGGYGGIFTTRVIGSQIFYQQIRVAISRGHRSNVFEVNVHIGESEEAGRRTYGSLIGRDGRKRSACGALAHVLEDFQTKPDEELSISQTQDGERHLDFLGMIKFRLKPHQAEILKSPDPMMAITRKNLEVQTAELVRHLQKMLASDLGAGLAPVFVYGTLAFNRTVQPDTESIEHFYMLEGNAPDQLRNLL
ncbi:MAG: hypothetical protein A3G34_06020 [Candidatus Lindowbacteria bacterium RIFCSPLOWO2_12_FULL_62_27]|nr:MAG: hypothetical protein A3G34_06020 [Candidatus Lindowbacteria bacterium RIFCSPLOWO2_12_FULL_62_27]OGH57468.1 MAG: hypothetical protein A3I06_06475 [Candidatus Lindowbacteria bacterium RIFCSPLOWO2_02_FULL_62_12]